MRVNESFLDLVDSTEEEVVGHHIYTFSPTERGIYESIAGEQVAIDERFLTDAQEHIAQLTSTGRISNWETYLIRRDKKIVPVEEKY